MTQTLQIADEISILMPAIARRILLEFFQKEHISQSQLLTLMAIYAREECRLSDLSAEMQITNPTASGLVDRLVKSAYVERIVDPKDRRAVKISLTAQGKKLAQKFRKTVKSKWFEILTHLPQKDQNDFIRILREIRKRV